MDGEVQACVDIGMRHKKRMRIFFSQMRIEANANTIKQHIYIYATVFSKVFKHKKSKTSLSCFGFSIFKTQKLFFSFKNQYEKQSVPNRFLLFFVFKNQKQFLKSIVKQAHSICEFANLLPVRNQPNQQYRRHIHACS